MSKIFLYLALVLVLASAGVGYLNYQRFQVSHQKLEEAQETMVQQEHLIDGMTKELEAAKTALGKQEEQAKKLDELQKDRDKAEADLAEAQKKIADQETYLKQQQDDITSRDGLIMELRQKKEAVPPTVAIPGQEKGKKGKKGKMSVVAQDAKDGQKAQEGKVLAVNDAWNFIVVNLGSQHGLVEGEEISIQRDGQTIAEARLSSIEPLTSVADIIPSSVVPGNQIQSGDKVLLSVPGASSPSSSKGSTYETPSPIVIPTPSPIPTASPKPERKEEDFVGQTLDKSEDQNPDAAVNSPDSPDSVESSE